MPQIKKTKQDNQILKALRKVEKKLSTDIKTVEKRLSTDIKTVEKRLSTDIKMLSVAVKKVESVAQDAHRLALASHHLSIKTNNSLQDVKQELILFKEENHREHVAMKQDNERDHAELRKLLLTGDKGAARLIAEETCDREETVEVLGQRVAALEKDVHLIRQRVFNTI